MRVIYQLSIYVIILIVFLIGNSFTHKQETHAVQPYNNSSEIYTSGSPTGMTGAPGENNCTLCHSGTINDGTATSSVNFSGIYNEYIPGNTYNLTLSIQNGSVKNGFQVVVLDSILNLNSGDLIITDTNNTQLFTGTRDYITHKTNGTSLTSWSFDWTAPLSDVGPITFYYSYNVTNNAGNPSGDQIFIGQHTISPSCSIMINDSIINNSPTLTAIESGAAYQWLDCDNNFAELTGETNQSFNATSNGNYAVAISQNNCTDTSLCITINNVGLNEKDLYNIQVHPNPTNNLITIQTDGFNGSTSCKIFDLQSNLLGTYKTKKINLDEFSKGIYIVKFYYGDKIKEMKVIKN